MSRNFSIVELGKVLKQRSEFIEIDDFATYKRCRVQLHAQGIVERDIVSGAEIKTKKQQICHANEFLVAEIDAKVGGFGIVPDYLEGAIVSSHYFLFSIDETILDRRFLDYYARTPSFREQVKAKGTTNYAAIRPRDVLSYDIPLPSLDDQHRIVARIEELAAKIAEVRGLRREANKEAEMLLNMELDKQFSIVAKMAKILLIGESGGFVTSGSRGWGDYYNESGNRRLIRVENVVNRVVDLSAAIKVAVPTYEGDIERSRVQINDVLVTITGAAIGRVGIVHDFDMPCHVSQHVALIRVSKDIEPYYLYWYLRSPAFGHSQTEGKLYGATKPGINLTDLRSLRIATPSLLNQQHLISHFNALQARIDALKQTQAESSAELDALLPSILDKAFRGEL